MRPRGQAVNGVLLDIKSASQLLGGSERWLRRLVADGRVPYRKVGRQLVFRRTELEQFFDSLPGVSPRQAKFNRNYFNRKRSADDASTG